MECEGMLTVAPLMIEHRLIERMIKVLKSELELIASSNNPNLVLVDSAVDFMRTYADRTHHGKEEEILFRDLNRKSLSGKYRSVMDTLIKEHRFARSETAALVEAKERHLKGDLGALAEMAAHMRTLIEFYPKHIEAEDQDFFVPVMDYFTEAERQAMLEEFRQFDRRMIHEKYANVVRRFEVERNLPGAKAKLDWIQTL
jgi:hemerythrin-like domain-containing protein